MPPGSLTSISHVIDVAERVRRGFPTQSTEWSRRAARYLALAEAGKDPYPLERGKIVSRGYVSPISTRVQGYTVYVPPDYTPDKRWPLMIVLHGGSSNGNLFLGVVLGNNMNWKEYDRHLWDTYEPRWSPPWIVAAPDGYGQVMWRYMGEQDVLDVIDDIGRHYSVDSDRVVLSGLSNGGVGAYSIGSRHASRFALVQAIAGAPSWIQYAGESSVTDVERPLLQAQSAFDLAENFFGTDFRYYMGDKDPGPMRPAYVKAFQASLERRKIPAKVKWYDAGHDLLYLVHRHGKIYAELEGVRRQQKPSEVHVVSYDLRAARQHWLEITRFAKYPALARLVGKAQAERIDVTTENVEAFTVDLRDVPLTGSRVEIVVDGVSLGPVSRSSLGHRAHLVKRGAGFGFGVPHEDGPVKRPGLSGPITDAYYARMVHVYGTQRAEHEATLKRAADKGARGWPMWLWTVEQEVVADRDVTPELAQKAHLVLYGTPGDNLVLDRIAPKLPIRVEGQGIVLGERRLEPKGVGTRFIYPNPEAPERYVIVQTAPTLEAVTRGHNLPDFVPDYVVYDATSARSRPRLVPSAPPPVRGYFDTRWALPPTNPPPPQR